MTFRRLFAVLTLFLVLFAAASVVSDYIPEVDANPANGPVLAASSATATHRLLTTEIRNPAGFAYLPDSDTYLISTDDRLFHEVSNTFITIHFTTEIPARPLKTGDTEGVAYLGNGQAAVLGENGVVVLMARDGTGWTETDRFALQGFRAGSQLGSAAFDPGTQTVFTAQKKGAKFLYATHLPTRDTTVLPMFLASHLTEKPNRNWQDYTIAGLHFHDGTLYAISEAFSSLIKMNTAGEVFDIVALHNINESAGVTMRDGKILLLGDAESYLPDPPIYVIDRP